MKKDTTPVKIVSLEVENVKRLQAVFLEPAQDGLTVIGGDNRQGKTSVLDAIMATIGGERYAPTKALREGSDKGSAVVTLSNGLVVTRSFTPRGSYLKISDPEGRKGGQALLNEFLCETALTQKKFMDADDKAKARILLEIIGVDLTPYEERHASLYKEREGIGRLRDRAKGHAESMPYNADVGTEILTPSDIMAELERMVAHNSKNMEIRNKAEAYKENLRRQQNKVADCKHTIDDLKERLAEAEAELEIRQGELDKRQREFDIANDVAKATIGNDKDTTKMKERLAQIEDTNAEVRKNLEREKALAEAEGYAEEYRALTGQINQVEEEKKALLDGAEMPLKGLTIDAGALAYNGIPWDGISGADQLRIATSISRKLNPKCGFVLIDKLEQMDGKTIREFGTWLKAEGLQAITTRVSTGAECDIIIEDGRVQGETTEDTDSPNFG